MINIPNRENRQWKQQNESDIFGTLWASKSLDLTSNMGKVRVSPRLMRTGISAQTHKTPGAFAYAQSKDVSSTNKVFWSTAGESNSGYLLEGSATPYFTFNVAAVSGEPTDFDSMSGALKTFVASAGNLWLTSNATLRYVDYSANPAQVKTPTSSPTVLLSTGFHALEEYAERMYVAYNTGKIASCNSSGTCTSSGSSTISTAIKGEITFMKAGKNRIWIGTLNTGGLNTKIYEWDGAAANTPTREYNVDAQGVLACAIKDDIPYVVDTEGRLLTLSGGEFVEIAVLPLNNKILKNATSPVANSANSSMRFIHSNGMDVINGRVHLLINNEFMNYGSEIPERASSGIWEYDPDIGLYHKYSFTYQFAQTADAGVKGAITDYGQTRIFAAGALMNANRASSSQHYNGSLLAGAGIYTSATVTGAAVFVDDTLNTSAKTGYFVTQKIESSGETENWNELVVKHKKLSSSNSKIVVKYRTEEATPSEETITWVNTTSFTTTGSSVTGGTVGVGDEVEITQGTGGGICSHITAISISSGTATVTVDETHTGVTTGTAKARFQKWKKAGTIQNQTKQSATIGLHVVSEWIQFKVYMFFNGDDEIDSLILNNKPNNPVN